MHVSRVYIFIQLQGLIKNKVNEIAGGCSLTDKSHP